MTSIQTGSSLTQQLYNRLYDRLNTNGDDGVSMGEMEALVSAVSGNALDAQKAFEALDTDGDKAITRAEMTASRTFGSDMIGALLQAQEANADKASGDWKAQSDKDVAALFARADTDGDGLLSKAEMDAEKTLRLAGGLDAGYGLRTVFMTRDSDGDGLLRPDEVVAGRLLQLPLKPGAPSPEIVRGAPVTPEPGQTAPTKPASPEETEQLRSTLIAERLERLSAPDGGWAFLAREMAGLSERARENAEAFSDSLAARLVKQLQDRWTPIQPPTTTGAGVTA